MPVPTQTCVLQAAAENIVSGLEQNRLAGGRTVINARAAAASSSVKRCCCTWLCFENGMISGVMCFRSQRQEPAWAD